MLTEWIGAHHNVPAAHILPRNTKNSILDICHMERSDVDNARNALLLSKPIEQAFDSMRLSFIQPNPLSSTNPIIMKCWDPDLVNVPAWHGADVQYNSIKSFDGR